MKGEYIDYLRKMTALLIRNGVKGLDDAYARLGTELEPGIFGDNLSDIYWYFSLLEREGSPNQLQNMPFPLHSSIHDAMMSVIMAEYLAYKNKIDALIKLGIDDGSFIKSGDNEEFLSIDELIGPGGAFESESIIEDVPKKSTFKKIEILEIDLDKDLRDVGVSSASVTAAGDTTGKDTDSPQGIVEEEATNGLEDGQEPERVSKTEANIKLEQEPGPEPVPEPEPEPEPGPEDIGDSRVGDIDTTKNKWTWETMSGVSFDDIVDVSAEITDAKTKELEHGAGADKGIQGKTSTRRAPVLSLNPFDSMEEPLCDVESAITEKRITTPGGLKLTGDSTIDFLLKLKYNYEYILDMLRRYW